MKQENRVSGQRLGKGKEDSEIELNQPFGGPWGAFSIMLFSHILVYYLYLSNMHYDGSLFYPTSLNEIVSFFTTNFQFLLNEVIPDLRSFSVYSLFILSQAIFAIIIPGLLVNGLPIPSENNRIYVYKCNALYGWYLTLGMLAYVHYTGLFRLTEIVDNYGKYLTVAVIWGNAMSFAIYITGFIFKKTLRLTGNHIYDFFMGSQLNPRIGILDLKMWAEIRISWILLFIVTLAAALKQYETHGEISLSLWFMLLAHFLYANACQKGEECIPTTWDIFYEKWGWMIIFWNFAGVPFAYSFQSIYLLQNSTYAFSINPTFITVNFVILVLAYYVWDTANSQKNRFRMMQRGTYVKRYAFPQLPWGTLDQNAKVIKSDDGKKTLLVDGWYAYARKIHYTADIIMALSWGLSCGFRNYLPYFYVSFFTGFLYHRVKRDEDKCKQKYGRMWQTYIKTVPYMLVPKII